MQIVMQREPFSHGDTSEGITSRLRCFWRERFLLVRINLIFRSLTLVAFGFPENPTLFDLVTGNKVYKVCGGVWRAATEVEEKENKVFKTLLPPRLRPTDFVVRFFWC
jgi:hypothetical protein